MRLEWIEDLLAVAEHGSVQAAAQARRLSQPAFSRRLRTIEDRLGATLVDRSARPARLTAQAEAELGRMRELAGELRALGRALGESDLARHGRLVLASQHAITTATAPALVERLADLGLCVRLRSANRDQCLALLLTREADIALIYDVAGIAPMAGEEFLETAPVGAETLVPVIAATATERLNDAFAEGTLPVIAYPADVFLGTVQRRLVFPTLARVADPSVRLETALTLAALECARRGLGVAWVPESLAAPGLASGALVRLDRLPTVAMRLLITRLSGPARPAARAAWNRAVSDARSQAEVVADLG